MNNSMPINAFLKHSENLFVSLERRFDDWLDMNFKKLRQLIQTPGSGTLTTVEHAVSSFLRLHLTTGALLSIIPSEEEKVVITTDDNLHSYLKTINSGRTLYISQNAILQQPEFSFLHIQVYVRQLDTIYISSDGRDVVMDQIYESSVPLEIKIQSNANIELKLQAPAIKLQVSNNGHVKISGSCQSLQAKVQSNGDFDARNLLAKDVVFSTQSNGNAWLFGSETLSIKHQANGFVHYFGEGRLKDVQHYGNGELRHQGNSPT